MKGERHPGADAPGLVEVPPHADGRARTETPDRPDLPPRPEEGLDPDNWEALRALGHRMVDDVVAFHRGLSEDRKSTRLNSSHVKISYAVFCLKKQTMA